jgi:CRP-like cAMP-binding protein
MACFATPTNLQTALEQHCERISKPRSTVLFRCGEKAFGLFVVFSGNVSLGFGVESALTRSYGPGALVGLPATLTGRSYCMTATVTEDADLCRQLLTVLGERMAENSEMQKALLNRDD